MKSVEEIVSLYQERLNVMSPLNAKMREIRDAYNGDIVLPVPEIDKEERSSVANLVATGLDQSARRVASVMPNIDCPTVSNARSEAKNALARRQALFGWWESNRMRLMLYKRARHFLGYAQSPVLLRPNFKQSIPRWHLRDPLNTFAPIGNNDMVPENCIFVSTQSSEWLAKNYPHEYRSLVLRDSSLAVNILEYVDEKEIVSIVLGDHRDPYADDDKYLSEMIELERIPNRADRPTAVIPTRITLDRPQGQFDGILGMYSHQAKLMALELIAIERGVFPEQWLIANPGEVAKIIAPADGLRGQVGMVQGGTLKDVQIPANFANLQAVDRLERNQRVTAQIPAEFGGESSTNVRTGRRGDSIMSATVDFSVQEAQECFAQALQEENRAAIAIAKGYFGKEKKSFYVNWKGAEGRAEYEASDLFVTDENYVSYAHAGADQNGLVISAGQRIGIGTMSKKRFMELDPLVDDPEKEHDTVIFEAIEQALVQSIQAQAADPQAPLPISDLAQLMLDVKLNKIELAEAIVKMQKKIQERQAQEAEANSPEAMPGMSTPQGASAAAGAGLPEPIPEQAPSSQNLAMMLQSLRGPQSGALPQEAAPMGA